MLKIRSALFEAISYRPTEIKIVGIVEIRIDKHKKILSLILRAFLTIMNVSMAPGFWKMFGKWILICRFICAFGGCCKSIYDGCGKAVFAVKKNSTGHWKIQ